MWLTGVLQSSVRWYKAFQTAAWAPEAVLISMNVSEADSALAVAAGEAGWLTQARAALRGEDAFVGGAGPGVHGSPEYWPRAYIYDPQRSAFNGFPDFQKS